MAPFEPPDEAISAVLEGKRMPPEKVVAWLLRILIALTGAAGLYLYQGVSERLALTITELHSRATEADTTHRELRLDVLAVEKRKLKSMTISPGITLLAPVPALMLDICQEVGR